ncbi:MULTISPECIES: RidA family protein [unclassified Sphingomonas]|uniref:RidA family protein n=1 Tax=Novosphingobium rhizosphaerae TaxID=1551649 RepID=UPI0015C84FF7
MSTIIRIEPGPRMSEAVVHNGTVYLAGQVGEAGDSVFDQTRTALAEIERLLILAGSTKAHMLSAMIWLADMADFDEMNRAWDAFVAEVPPPARATGQASLADPAWRVEIVVTAAVA